MAVYQCKMCGAKLNLEEGATVVVCEYCDTQQTVPTANDEKKMTLFSRANRLRAACEFDKAAGLYENIVSEFPEEAEAYWGLLLCKYGIEYVDDPATGKKIPTCHRSSFESIMDDPDFEQTLENADVIARKVYRAEAKTIDGIQKGILEISGKEEPYDIFICYKETDESGTRTIDSVLAQDIYDMLTDSGYRVFFARVTLEDKLGTAYEPYIFAALNSAKIMLAIGTDYEYYNAVWVKNEWSRFLAMMSRDKKKVLIPCYKNIDAYDIPKEFKHLQAQDLGKVGAMQDLLRGIKKILPKTAAVPEQAAGSQAVPVQTVVSPMGANVSSLLQRVFIFLEDGDWKSAGEYCEKVLDLDPKNGQAYLGKLMAELKVHKREALKDQAEPFDDSDYYQKIMRYGDEALQREVAGYNDIVRQASIYKKAAAQLKLAKTIEEYEQVKKMLIPIRSFEGVEALIEKCDEGISAIEEIYQKASAMAASGDYLNAIISYSSIVPYKDSVQQISHCSGFYYTKISQQKSAKRELAELQERVRTLQYQAQKLHMDKESLRQHKENQAALMQRRNALASELSGLGVFAFSRKKQLQTEIIDCDAQLAQLANKIAALENGTNYDAAIQQSQAELEKAMKDCATLEQRIDALQKDIDATPSSDEALTDRVDCQEFGTRVDSMLILSQEALASYSSTVQEYIQTNIISNVVIPAGVTSIGDKAFSGCSSLTAITIPDSVTSIGNSAFYECSSLTAVTIPDSVTSIGDSAFFECSSLTAVTIPDSVTSIGDMAFLGCSSLTSITIPSSVTSIGNGAFLGCSSLTSINISSSVTSIGGWAFSDCSSLTSITIPSSVTSIGEDAFKNCSSQLTIKGEQGSYAKAYAQKENIPFRAI